jgi:hypothetical protein
VRRVVAAVLAEQVVDRAVVDRAVVDRAVVDRAVVGRAVADRPAVVLRKIATAGERTSSTTQRQSRGRGTSNTDGPWRLAANSSASRRLGNANMRFSDDGHHTTRTTTTHG